MLLLYTGVLFAHLQTAWCTNILELVSSIAENEDRVRPERLEVCVVQVGEYADRRSLVHDTMKSVVEMLERSYPVTITRHGRFVNMLYRRDASLVLMDASGLGAQLSSDRVSKRLSTHECYSKSAKFITIVDASSNVTALTDLFAALGIMNYLVVPVHVPAEDPRNGSEPVVGELYTMNHFSRREYLFDIRDHKSSDVGRYFPNKLTDVHGYKFYLAGTFEFPYLIDLLRGNRTAGLLKEALSRLFVRRLNGTLKVSGSLAKPSDRSELDVTFGYADFRTQFMHDFTLLERGGYCLVCPFRTERDFMSHLLKPFSLGIWLAMGIGLAVCFLLGRLFPRQFQRDLLEMIFFGNSVPYLLPFPTRIVSFVVALTIFFLSEAYNTKIISLMSLQKYYERPETLQEFVRSPLKIAIPGLPASLLAEQLPGKVLSVARANEIYRERSDMMFDEYCSMAQCHTAMLYAADMEGERGYIQYVLREQVMTKLMTLQLATHSPFYAMLVDFLMRYYQSGVWMYRADGLRNDLRQMVETIVSKFIRVVFHFEDLFCVWVLILVGWLLSLVGFIGELLTASLMKKWKRKMRKT